MLAIFWISVISILYTYFGYPILLLLLARARDKRVKADKAYTPSVSHIITVHNEAARISRKIMNTLMLEYPAGKLEVLIASDASTDETDHIVKSHGDKGIRLVRSPYRGGKELAQRNAIEQATGEILVFSDVATMLEKDALRTIVTNFADRDVGCVSSEDRVVDEQGNISGEGAYVRYEMWLRALETRAHSVVGLSGSFFAARKSVCRDWPTNIPSDFNTLLNSIRHGMRGISDPQSIGIYTTVRDSQLEFQRKVRTITRGISALMANRGMLNTFRYGLFSWQLISHKLLRWMIPWFMIAALTANLILALKGVFYKLMLIGQCLFYILSFLGSRREKAPVFMKVPYFFTQANLSIFVSWMKYLKGERYVTWTPSGR